MSLPCYLAMTAWEMADLDRLPPNPAWMACHFSPYSTGLSNCPTALPAGSMLILNDRTPICGHDPALIAGQLQELVRDHSVSGILMDFQRPGQKEAAAVAKAVADLPVSVGITENYAADLDCAVFLSPPLHIPLKAAMAPWAGRELWLDMVPECCVLSLTEDGCAATALPCCCPEQPCHQAQGHFCRYRIQLFSGRAEFTLYRTGEDLQALLQAAPALGFTRAMGLYQQLAPLPGFTNKNPAD